MKQHLSSAASTYGPAVGKSFAGALDSFFATELPQVGGAMTRKHIVAHILQMIEQYYPKSERLQQGQMPWVATHKDDRLRYGHSVASSQLTQVYLTPTPPSEIDDRAHGKRLREIKIDRVASLCKEAYAQDGVLTNAEIAIMLKTTPTTVGKYIRIWEEEHDELLPRRGTIHDLGPTLTHKKEICHALLLEGKSVGDVMRETYHSAQSIHRYISAFKRVLTCRKNGLDQESTRYALHMSRRLCQEYFDLIDLFVEENVGLDDLLKAHITTLKEEQARQRLQPPAPPSSDVTFTDDDIPF